MHWLDIVILAVIIVTVFIGMKKGLISSLLSLANWVVSFIAAFFLAQPLSSVFNTIFKIDTALGGVFAKEIGKMGAQFTIAAPAGGINAVELINTDGNFWLTLLKKLIDTSVEIPEGRIPAAFLGNILGGFASIIIGGITAFILIRLLIMFINGLVKKLKKSSKVFKNIDGSLGALFGFIKSIIIIAVFFIALSFLKVFPFIDKFSKNEIQSKTFIAKYCEKGTEWVVDWTAENINIQDIIKKVVKGNSED